MGDAIATFADGGSLFGATVVVGSGGFASAPGLTILKVSDFAGGAGQALQDLAFDRPAAEMLLRGAANAVGGQSFYAVIPRSVRNDVGDALAGIIGEKFISEIPELNPQRCQ